MVTLTIDGKQITVPRTATIYEAAKQVGVDIPVLCYAKKLLPYGACRVCLVEVEQMKGRLIPSCTTPVTEGMVVRSSSDEINKVRKTVLEFLLVNHVLDCPICDKAGECDLQDLAYDFDCSSNRFEGVKFDLPKDEVNPLIERNMNRCVLCGKCVRVCDEIVGYGSYSFINRGFETKIATAFDRGLNCEFCGQCVSMCPVGAILPRPFKFKARPWQLTEVDSVCGYCGNGCTVTFGVLKDKVETIRFNDKNGVNDGNLCVRGRFGYSFINSKERLTKPLLRKNGRLVPVSWVEALSAVAAGLQQAQASKGVGILAGARLTNEEFFLLKNLAKTLGTRNIDHSGGECYKGVTEGLLSTLGVTASTGTYPQVEEAEAILSIRSDFYETHPVFGMVVNQAVKRREADLFVISDKKGKFTKLPGAKTLLTKPGTEVNILNAMAFVLLDENLAVTEGVEGIAELKSALAAYTPEAVEAQTGVDAELLRAAARRMALAKRAAILLAYGLPYADQSREIAIAAANLALLTGIAGRDGSGLYLCGEKANSQGAIDLGILPGSGALGSSAMLAGQVDALYVIAEDPLSVYPNRAALEAALKQIPFLIVQDIFLTPTAELAHVVLPATSYAEKDGTFTNAERRIQRVRPGVSSPGEAQADGAIFAQLDVQLGGKLTATDPQTVFAAIALYQGIDFAAIGAQGTVWGGETLALPQRKVQPVQGRAPVEGLVLVTGSALYHNGTLSTHASGPNAVEHEAYLEFGREDAAALQVKEGEIVTLKGNGAEIRIKVKIGHRLPKGVLFSPNHFGSAGLNRIWHGAAVTPVQVSK
jgi:NADH-quinone oxidoreductase chain G